MQHKILIIDDETSSLEVMVETLNAQNYKILMAVDGLSGYEIAQKTLPDLIIIDWEMAKLNGIETIVLLKNNPQTKEIPIIMATGKRLEAVDLQTALESGAIDYIRKPFDKIELLARARSTLLLFETTKENTKLQLEIKEKEILYLNNTIEEKNKDLAQKILYMNNLEKRTENILKNISDIVNTNQTPVVIQTHLKKMLTDNTEQNFSNIWTEFETVFSQVNQNFFSAIQQKHPDITPAERKMCAFIKLNLSTKDIAELTHTSLHAIQKSRHRLRKRFNLLADDDLYSVIQSF